MRQISIFDHATRFAAIAALCSIVTVLAAEPGTTRGVILDIDDASHPANAVQLVGPVGHSLIPESDTPSRWRFRDGVLTASPAWDSLITKKAYRDFRMHLEFNVNEVPDAANPEKNGNSGVYIQQRYELQILNSHGVAPEDYKASYGGSLYRLKKPDRLVNKKAGEWQSYDIVFRAARFDGEKKVENARVTAYQNEQLIHDDVSLPNKTGAGKKEGPDPLPIKLQGHHNPVRFRNVWIQELDLSSPIGSATPRPHPVPENPLWLTYEAKDGPGNGRHIVLIAAEQEYRSEQSMPMMARILAEKHGFHCTVLFSVNDKGEADPTLKIRWEQKDVIHHVPGLQHLETADLMILFSRLITLPEEEVQHIVDYVDAGKPLIGLRTANHGFLGFPYTLEGRKVRFGEDVLGGSFRSHHGNRHADSTRGIIVEDAKNHPILLGVEDIWGPSDVYRTYPEGGSLPPDCQPLLLGQPLLGRQPDDAPNPKKIPLPIAWTKTWTGSTGTTGRVFHLTMGSARDYQNEGLRRLTINAAYWCLNLEKEIKANRSVEIQGPYEPLASGFNYGKLGVVPKKPAELR